MQDLTYATFAPQIGSSFQVIFERTAALTLELAEVENHSLNDPNRNNRGRQEPFALTFHGPLTPIMPQQIFELDHEQLGRLQLFLVPIGPDPKSRQKMCYQAIFN